MKCARAFSASWDCGFQRPSDEQLQKVKPLTEGYRGMPCQKRDEGVPKSQGPGLEADFQQVSQSKTGDICALSFAIEKQMNDLQ
ncbi:hypothetical protein P7K49_019589 [Saguinus oedipus]|uniref:GAGE domain-containing protein n=1 Tax=Saguinus oedipus TaxID=9490 RepID=A0ABQ9UY25_SAGOE|nr:hypothetical protein P7K49_019589 [Saguinus oedipus]